VSSKWAHIENANRKDLQKVVSTSAMQQAILHNAIMPEIQGVLEST
jgi:hypothetical protein